MSRLHDAHDVVVVDTAGAATQATIFAIGCADLVLVPIQTSSADIVEAIKTVNLIKSASLMMKREVTARVLLTALSAGHEHLRAYREAKLPRPNCQSWRPSFIGSWPFRK